MKMQSTSLLTEISAEQLENLTTLVNETLATCFDYPKSKIFTAAELWNIQRQSKSRIPRRMFA